MNKIFYIAVLVTVSALFGQYTPEGQRYSSAVEQVRKQHIKIQVEYAKNSAQIYRWSLIDIYQYPCWCAEIDICSNRGKVISISEKGSSLRSIKDQKKNEHIMIPSMGYIDRSKIRIYRMNYFYMDSTGAWVKEKEPVETEVGISEDGSYFYCLK